MHFDKHKNPEKNRFLNTGSELKLSHSGQKEKKRNVPLGLKLKIFFSDVKAIIGIAFTLTGSIFVIVFGSFFWEAGTGLNENDPTAPGAVEYISGTGTEINGRRVYKYGYSFSAADGKRYTGTDEQFVGIAVQGDTVKIRYSAKNPEISEFADFRESVMPWWIMLFIGIFPGIGLIILALAISKTQRTIAVLKVGETAWGQFAGQEPTNTKVNKQTVYRLFFKFTAPNGQEYTATGVTHKTYALKDEENELVVFDPNKPENAFPADAFPKAVKNFLLKN